MAIARRVSAYTIVRRHSLRNRRLRDHRLVDPKNRTLLTKCSCDRRDQLFARTPLPTPLRPQRSHHRPLISAQTEIGIRGENCVWHRCNRCAEPGAPFLPDFGRSGDLTCVGTDAFARPASEASVLLPFAKHTTEVQSRSQMPVEERRFSAASGTHSSPALAPEVG